MVEDDDVIRKALRQILGELRYDVDFSPTVTGAIAGLIRKPTHLVLDLLLPDGSGLIVLRRIQELELPIRSIARARIASQHLASYQRLTLNSPRESRDPASVSFT